MMTNTESLASSGVESSPLPGTVLTESIKKMWTGISSGNEKNAYKILSVVHECGKSLGKHSS
jgi:hypothetical protein